MGVSEFLHLGRFLRKRRRRIADENRHFVVGSDKTEAARCSSVLPKGSHFVVSYSTLSNSEQDVCNNNGSSRTSGEGERSTGRESTVIFSLLSGSPSGSEVGTGRTNMEMETLAVLTTTELEEVQLFGEVSSKVVTKI